jgi:hypothetical protein
VGTRSTSQILLNARIPSLSKRWEPWLFPLLIAISLVPVWAFEFFPSQDGPVHLWILSLLSSYNEPENDLIREFLRPNTAIEPNLGFYLVAYPLALVFGVGIAEKIFLTVLALTFAYGVRYAIGKVNPSGLPLSYLAIPMAFWHHTHMGFYNFQLGVAFFVPVLFFCIYQYSTESRYRYFSAGSVGLLLVLVHLIPFVLLIYSIGAYVASVHVVRMFNAQGNWSSSLYNGLRSVMAEGGKYILAFVPALAVAFMFGLRHGVSENPSLGYLSHLQFFRSFQNIEILIVALPMALVLLALVIHGVRTVWKAPRLDEGLISLLGLMLALIVLYVFVPLSSNDLPVNPRLAVMIALVALVVLSAAMRGGTMAWPVVPLAAFVIILTATGLRYIQYDVFTAEIAEMVSLSERMQEGSTFLPVQIDGREVLPVGFGPKGSRVEPLAHVGGYVAARGNHVYLRSTIMSLGTFGYFPVVYRESRDPFAILGGDLDRVNPAIRFDDFVRLTGRPIDYLLIVDAGWPSVVGNGVGRVREQTMREIETRYRWVGSSESGRYHLFKSTATDGVALETS